MADDVTLPGTGAIVKTIEKTGAEHVQLVGLDIGSGVASAPVGGGPSWCSAVRGGGIRDTKLRLGEAMGPRDYDEQDTTPYPAQSAEQEAADRLTDDESAWVYQERP